MAFEKIRRRYMETSSTYVALRLEDYAEVQTWLKTVSPSTRPNYLAALKKLCEFCGKNPKQLILERDEEIKNPDPNSRTAIRDLVLDFREYLEKEGYAPKSIRNPHSSLGEKYYPKLFFQVTNVQHSFKLFKCRHEVFFG
jgi:hypothetical protein